MPDVITISSNTQPLVLTPIVAQAAPQVIKLAITDQTQVVSVQVPGVPGPANTLTMGTVTTLAPGSPASATITGTSPGQVLSLAIPRGLDGPSGGATSIATGGTTGQALVKTANTDYATGWKTLATPADVSAGDTALANRITPLETANSNATQLPENNTLMKRGSSGTAQVNDPVNGLDISNRSYVITTVGSAVANLASKTELTNAVSPLATKTELSNAVSPLVTKTELSNAVSPLATKAEVAALTKVIVLGATDPVPANTPAGSVILRTG